MSCPIRILLSGTGKSLRSQIAEAQLRHLGGEDFEAYNTGNDLKPIHSLTRQIMT